MVSKWGGTRRPRGPANRLSKAGTRLMAISAERRSQINRDNAKKSTGPRSPAGRERASRNAAKHLLRAEELAFDDADAALLRDTLPWWSDSYVPETPAEVEFINIAATASVQIQ